MFPTFQIKIGIFYAEKIAKFNAKISHFGLVPIDSTTGLKS